MTYMKVISLLVIATLGVGVGNAYGQEIQSIQPEDFTQHRLETEIVPAKTIYIEIRKPEQAAELISQSHIDQARLGWRIFDVSLYLKNGDFRGFFVTYVKVGESE